MCSEIYVGDYGTALRATIYDQNGAIVDLSISSNIIFNLEKPDGSIISVPATFVTDGTNGQVQYITEPGDIDMVGHWRLQAVVFYSIREWHSSIYTFKVYKPIPTPSV